MPPNAYHVYHVYQGELYPTMLRATGGGGAYSLSRLATAAMPFVLLPLLEDHGPNTVFVFIACAMGAVILNVGLLGPRTTGTSLDDPADARRTSGTRETVTGGSPEAATGEPVRSSANSPAPHGTSAADP